MSRRFEAIHAEVLAIPFKASFKHASAERSRMQSLWVEVQGPGGRTGVGEGCPREYVTGESLESARAFIDAHRREWLDGIADIDSLRAWVVRNRALVDANPAAWCAVELAFLDCLGQMGGLLLERLIGTPSLRGRYRYSAVIGDGPAAGFDAQLGTYLKAGFTEYKIKLSGDRERDLGKVRALSDAGVAPACVRADANNLWKDAGAAIAHLSSLDYAFFALEEPLGAGDVAGMREIASALGARIVLDESVLREEHLAPLAADADRWILNVRVSKMGGLLRSVVLVRAAKTLGLRYIVGAHVGETSVLTRAGLTVADTERDMLAAQEGAFGTHLLERDPVMPSLCFGPAGVLDLAPYRPIGPGLGLRKVPVR